MGDYRDLRKFIIVGLIVLATIVIGSVLLGFKFTTTYSNVSLVFFVPTVAYTILLLLYLPTRIILYTLYKPFEDKGHRPKVSVIVPTYNEGKFVSRTLEALMEVDYPGDLIEVIAVDDGSTDDTAAHIISAADRFKGRIRPIILPRNMGKREAMAAGVSQAKGDVVVFIDSDTVVEKDSIRSLVAPFEDPRVGGTTGKVKVHNWDRNILTRMLGVRYVMSFDFYRSTSSVFGGVTCLSGVISAYRMEILKKAIPSWLEQRFLGRKCTFGDDRSLTNHTLKQGYRTVYSRKAVAHTLAPENLPKLARMLIRWNRSFIRESLILFGYLLNWKVLRRRKMLFYDSCINTVLPFTMIFILILLYIRIATNPIYLLTTIASIALMSMIYMFFYIRSERSWQFVFGILYAFFYITVLIWLLPYALLTVNRTGWGTR